MGGAHSPLNDTEFLNEIQANSRLMPYSPDERADAVQRLHKLVERNRDFHAVNVTAHEVNAADMDFINGLVKEVEEWNQGISSRGWIISKVYGLFARHMFAMRGKS